MSGTGDEEKSETGKVVPLDLASKVATVKTVDGKAPLLIPGPLRVLTQSVSGSGQTTVTGTMLTASIVPQAVLKQGVMSGGQTQNQVSGTIQRQAQITLATQVVAQNPSSGTTYHVPRGPAVVANLAAPRSNVATAIRAPMVVPTQTSGQVNKPTAFVRPPRTPSPAQGTTWMASNSSNSSQIKSSAPAVLSSPIRGTTVSGIGNVAKQQIVARAQSVSQNISPIRPTTILHSAITIGQGGQIHPYKPGQGTTGIQTLSNAVTLAQVLPSRTQTLVYSAGNTAHFATAPRLTIANTVTGQRQITTPRATAQVTTARLTVPVNVTQSGTRLVTPQATVLASNARLSSVPSTQSTVIGSTSTRIVSTTQQNVSIGRLAVTVANASQSNTPAILGQTKIAIHPLLVANNSQTRTIPTQGTKVIAQPAQGTAIHLAQIPAGIKSSQNIVTTAARTIVQPATIVSHRPGTVVTSQAIPIAKVFSSQEGQQTVAQNLYIHPVTRRSSPGPTNTSQTTSTTTTTPVTTTVTTYSTYFYDAAGSYSVARSFNQQSSSFTTIPQSNSQQIRPSAIGSQVHNLVTKQSMRFNPIMVLEQSRNQQQYNQQHENAQEHPTQQTMPLQTKMTASPRPSILRKRDNEGSPLKAAKNLGPVLSNMVQQQQQQQQQVQQQQTQVQPPGSPPSRPDSRGNGHSSGGSTTISATSSPGLGEVNDDSLLHVPVNIKEEEENRPPIEMSPRKKPRKQQLTGNDIMDETNDDMQFLSENNIKKDYSDGNQSDGPKDGAPESDRVSQIRKPASALLINSYRHNWKTTHNHYLRYSDVRPKEERRPTIIDLANQHKVLDKINGWKIHHLSTQMDDLADQEQTVYDQLTELLKVMESKEGNKLDQDVNRINELIKGNLQRIKIINDGMLEAKSNIMKIFDHKVHVSDIINRCASKRNFKKREKS